ncbi:hypothetical protein [Jatrophihabitans sp.]|uniref:hypothetical protein n=1 Tax=Jatrophihabitans sp. TaxID=1932789 RepID=UPI002C687F71|nr:hypothetical protein [Jatrophihabitans sp.]
MTELTPTDGQPAEEAGPAAARVRPGPRPSPAPSPTARARRSAAGAPDGLRRPRPTPFPPAADGPATDEPAADGAPAAGPVPAPDAGPVRDATLAHNPGPARDAAPVRDAAPGEATGAPTTPADPAVLLEPAEQADRSPWRARTGLVAVLAVLLLALAGLDGWLVTHQPGSGSRSERDQALSTAKTAVPAILSYDYRHFDSDVSTARGRLTGRAVTDYVQAMSKTIKPTAAKVHAVVQAQTDGAGVEAVSADGKQVTVVVFGEQKVTNTSLSQPRIDLFRVRVTLDRVDNQWLVSKFDQI